MPLKNKTLFLQLCSSRQSQGRKLPVRISIERLNVLLLVFRTFSVQYFKVSQ